MTPSYYNATQLADFKQRLAIGAATQNRFADLLRAFKIPVTHVSRPYLGKPEDVDWFARNETDVIANRFYLELKGLGRYFTGPKDFPFKRIALESVAGFHAKRHAPDFYVILSQITGLGLWVPVSTFHQWLTRPLVDRKRQTKTLSYFAPLELAQPLWKLVAELSTPK